VEQIQQQIGSPGGPNPAADRLAGRTNKSTDNNSLLRDSEATSARQVDQIKQQIGSPPLALYLGEICRTIPMKFKGNSNEIPWHLLVFRGIC
jgi:hypothetical protein